MRAITYSRYGPPEVLRLEEVERPTPGDDEILVRMRAAEATKADCELRAFRFAVRWFALPLRLAFGVFRPRRRVLGGYGAGVVAEVGRNVTRFAVGDEVFGSFGFRMGAYGEFVVANESATLARKPANMTFVEAAAVGLGGLNALHFMDLARIRPGERVLVNGAGGSIGMHAVQIAVSRGAEVTAVDHGRKEPGLRRLGIVDFVDYTREDFASRGVRYDVIFDMAVASPFAAAARSLAPGGRYLTGNPTLADMFRCAWTTRTSDRSAFFRFAGETLAELETLRAMIESGELGPIVDSVLPIERAAEAHRRVEAEDRIGAIVLDFGE